MGFRAGIKNGGGGFWNNVDGKFVGYEFTTTNVSGEAGDWVYLVPEFHADGAEKSATQHLFMGGADRYSISDDGLSLSMADGGPVTFQTEGNKGFISGGKFLESLVEAGFDESELPDLEAGEPLNLEAVIGYRIRLKQLVDVKATAARGKQKDKKDPSKSYDRTVPIVAAVYGKDGGKTAAKGTKAPVAAKGAPKGDPIQDKADAAMKSLLDAAKDNVLPVSKISVAIIRQLVNDKDKNAVKDLAKSEAYLTSGTERGIFVYDSDEETVSAA